VIGQSIATGVAMTSNFFINNELTYRDSKLHGWAMARGLLLFYLVCLLGAFANVGVAAWIYGYNHIWWAAGLAGVVMGSVWNYALSSVFVWRQAT
jgi:dolichol-phosphate mannosyltransferase